MNIDGCTVLFILPRQGFPDDVFNDASMAAANSRAQIQVASVNGETVESKRNILVLPDVAVSDVDVSTVDAVVLVGCKDAVPYLEREPVYEVLRTARETGTVIGAICATPLLLGKTGLLDGLTVTGHETVLAHADEYGFTSADDAVAVDDGVVTAAEEYATRFGEELVDQVHQRVKQKE